MLEHVAAVHEEQRIYDCFYCDVTYKYKSNLRAHIKKKHTQETHCPKCLGKEFDQFPDLVKHLMESHNDKSQAPLKFANYRMVRLKWICGGEFGGSDKVFRGWYFFFTSSIIFMMSIY